MAITQYQTSLSISNTILDIFKITCVDWVLLRFQCQWICCHAPLHYQHEYTKGYFSQDVIAGIFQRDTAARSPWKTVGIWHAYGQAMESRLVILERGYMAITQYKTPRIYIQLVSKLHQWVVIRY